MGLSDDDLKSATIIPAGCVFVIGLGVLACCCLRYKNRNEQLERRRGFEKFDKRESPLDTRMGDDKPSSTNSHLNGGANCRTFSEIPFESNGTNGSHTLTPCSNLSYEDDDLRETIYDSPTDDKVRLQHEERETRNESSKEAARKPVDVESETASSSSASIRDVNKLTSQVPVSM